MRGCQLPARFGDVLVRPWVWASLVFPAFGPLLAAPGEPYRVEATDAGIDPAQALGGTGGTLFLLQQSTGVGSRLWASEGSPFQVRVVKDLRQYIPPSGAPTTFQHAVLDERFFFLDGYTSSEPWESDGTAGGTRLTKDLSPRSFLDLTAAGGRLCFREGGQSGRYFALPLLEVAFQRRQLVRDGDLDISDGIALSRFLFLGEEKVSCLDEVDVDDSGFLDISEPISLLSHLFLGRDPPAEPLAACGTGPTAWDSLGCDYCPGCR